MSGLSIEREHIKEQSKYINTTSIPGLCIVKRPVYEDDRGFFQEIYQKGDLESVGVNFDVVQHNRSLSVPRVVRALHVENWDKYVHPDGVLFSAIVDTRPGSPTYRQVECFIFNNSRKEENELINWAASLNPGTRIVRHGSLFIPKGCANSLCAFGYDPVMYYYLVNKKI